MLALIIATNISFFIIIYACFYDNYYWQDICKVLKQCVENNYKFKSNFMNNCRHNQRTKL